MAAYNKFNVFAQKLTDASINFPSDTFKCALTNTLPTATNAVIADITQISGTNGYTTGGTATTITESASSGTVTEKGSTVVFTATGSMGPFRYAVFYDSTANVLIGWWDYGSAITLNSGDTFTVTFDPTNGILQLS